MSLIALWRAHRLLTPTQRRVLSERRLSGRYTAEQWLGLLERIAELDRQADAARKRCGLLAIIGIVAAFLGLMFLVPLLSGVGAPDWLVGILALLLLGLPIVCGVLYFTLRGRDLPNNLRELIYPLLCVLREDVAPNTPLELEADLRGGMVKDKRTDEQNLSRGRLRYPKILETHYLDPWLSGAAALADGSTLRWKVADRIRVRRITKRTARGKVKTKYKHKSKRLLEVSLGLRHKSYQIKTEPATDQQVQVRPGERRDALRLTKLMTLSGSMRGRRRDLDWTLPLDPLLELVSAAYGRAVRSPSTQGA